MKKIVVMQNKDMVMHVINASQWQRFEEGDTVCYSIGQQVSSDQSCRYVYLPFAWVRINHQTNQIMAARDHFGQEPFYYWYQSDRFIFGSTLPDILAQLPFIPNVTKNFVRDCFLRTPMDDPIDDPPYSTLTYYEGIFRVTPAHYLHINGKNKSEISFWSLDVNRQSLYYTDPRDYVEHFGLLLDEAIRETIPQTSSLAAEFSGGVDSSAILVACQKASLAPTLFTHIPPLNRIPTEEDRNVANTITQFNLFKRHHLIDAKQFDPIAVFKRFADIFAGPPPNMNCVLSNPLHQAVVEQGCDTLLSGYGGDDCVSLLFPSEIIAQANRQDISDLALEYEYNLIQGTLCHEMRMRMEYSAVAAKAMGLRYVYPLLYPPLMEYCFSLPFEQKFKQGEMRCTIRRYLLQYIVGMTFNTKKGAVVPSAMQKCRDYYAQGRFESHFVDLPFQNYIDSATTLSDKLLLQINAFMLKEWHSGLVQRNRGRSSETCTA